jgi:hypothetical protein
LVILENTFAMHGPMDGKSDETLQLLSEAGKKQNCQTLKYRRRKRRR